MNWQKNNTNHSSPLAIPESWHSNTHQQPSKENENVEKKLATLNDKASQTLTNNIVMERKKIWKKIKRKKITTLNDKAPDTHQEPREGDV